MPTNLIIHLEAPQALFFDERWPLEACFLAVLEHGPSPPVLEAREGVKPYAFAPLWRAEAPGPPQAGEIEGVSCTWRVSLLDDALLPPFMAGLEAAGEVVLDGTPLQVQEVTAQRGLGDQKNGSMRA